MYFLVYWPAENSYSTIADKKAKFYFLDGNVCNTSNVEEVVGFLLRIEYGSGKCFNGKIVNSGSKQEMRLEENRLSMEAAERSFEAKRHEARSSGAVEFKSGRKHKTPISNDARAGSDTKTKRKKSKRDECDAAKEGEIPVIEDIDQPSPPGTNDSATLNHDQRLKELEDENEKLKLELKKIRRLVRKKSALSDVDRTPTMDLGGGVKISQSVYDWARLTCSGNPSVFMRKLVFDSGLFDLTEIASSSMTGKAAANCEPKPALNPIKFKAIQDHVIASFGLVKNTYEMLLFERRIKNICTDARKKLKKANQV